VEAGTENENFELPEESVQPTTAKTTVKTLRAEDSISIAKSLLEGTGFRHIPIVNPQNRIEGLVSDRDLLRVNNYQADELSAPIATIMTKRVLTCFPETPLRQAAHTMLEEGFSSLPVVDPSGVLLGILTTGDILKALVNEHLNLYPTRVSPVDQGLAVPSRADPSASAWHAPTFYDVADNSRNALGRIPENGFELMDFHGFIFLTFKSEKSSA